MHFFLLDTPTMPEWAEIAGMFETAAKLIGMGAVVTAAILWVVKTIKTLKAPQKSLEDRIESIEDHQAKDLRRFENQDRINENQNEVNSLMLRAIMDMQSHMLDGNHTTDLQKSRDDIKKYLIERK